MTDGPYAEAEEVLAGYWIVECESFDRATEIAARLTSCPAPSGCGRERTRTCVRSTSTSRTSRANLKAGCDVRGEIEDLLRCCAAGPRRRGPPLRQLRPG